MTVYVDPLRQNHYSKIAILDKSCHMAADTTDELLAFAVRIGLREYWVQNTGTYREHFDLTPRRRAAAVRAGAVELGMREFVTFLRSKIA